MTERDFEIAGESKRRLAEVVRLVDFRIFGSRGEGIRCLTGFEKILLRFPPLRLYSVPKILTNIATILYVHCIFNKGGLIL